MTLTDTRVDKPKGPGARAQVQKFGTFLSNMVMPNIGAFIAWGLITALFYAGYIVAVGRAGVIRYSDMMPEQGHYELLLFNDCYACDPASKVNWRTTGLFLYDYASTIQAAAKAYQVEPALIRALIHAESAFNPLAVSRKGAMGLTQLMPATARELGVGNALLAEQNIFGGVKYLAGLLKQYDGNVALATAAYNAGAGAVQKHGGIPPYAETRAYVERVKLLHQRYKEMLSAKGL